nr:hypothetical protein [uncultured Chitinophaga sp.]
MQHTWDILTYLIDGSAISIFLFLIASLFISGLKNVQSVYLRIANTIFAILGLIALAILATTFSWIAINLRDNKILDFLAINAALALVILLLLSAVPIMAFSRKRVARTGFTWLLLISVIIITHVDAFVHWVNDPKDIHYFLDNLSNEAPVAKWYRLLIALLFFMICYWFTRRKINRA